MKLGILMSDFRSGSDFIDKVSAEKLGIIFVGNGVYHATIKDGGAASPVLGKAASFYVLGEDLESRGFSSANVDSRAKVVNYSDLVDIIFNDYEKIIWI